MAKKKAAKAVKAPAEDMPVMMADAPDGEGAPEKYVPNYKWMNKSRQWGVRVKPSKAGLRLGDLNVGIYGEIPTQWNDQSRNPRGAIPCRGMPPVGYAVREKAGMWADCAADLYEEAIQRRWAPATDVPWDTVKPLPGDVERATCQVLTELVQYSNTDIEAISQWQHQMSYGYHEVKQYLSTASFDAARHYECFRKRTLINGGGMGIEGPGQVTRMILESRGGWTEAVAYMILLRGTFAMTILRYLEHHANNDAERFMYRHALQDRARLQTYGLDHLKFAAAHVEDQTSIMAVLLAIGDRVFSLDLRDPVLREALAIVFGGGVKNIRKGMDIYDQMMRDFVAKHLEYCAWLNVPRGINDWPEQLAKYLDPALLEAAGAA